MRYDLRFFLTLTRSLPAMLKMWVTRSCQRIFVRRWPAPGRVFLENISFQIKHEVQSSHCVFKLNGQGMDFGLKLSKKIVMAIFIFSALGDFRVVYSSNLSTGEWMARITVVNMEGVDVNTSRYRTCQRYRSTIWSQEPRLDTLEIL